MATVTHIAGLDVTIHDRYLRQRCAWCDEVLIDHDLALVAVALDSNPTSGPPVWPAGRLVRVDGSVSHTLDEGEPLPGDACSWASTAAPADFGG